MNVIADDNAKAAAKPAKCATPKDRPAGGTESDAGLCSKLGLPRAPRAAAANREAASERVAILESHLLTCQRLRRH